MCTAEEASQADFKKAKRLAGSRLLRRGPTSVLWLGSAQRGVWRGEGGDEWRQVPCHVSRGRPLSHSKLPETGRNTGQRSPTMCNLSHSGSGEVLILIFGHFCPSICTVHMT